MTMLSRIPSVLLTVPAMIGAWQAGCRLSAPDFDPPAPTELQMQVVTTEFEVAPGDEAFMCTVTDTVLTDPFDVVMVYGYQLTGGHHAALFYTTLPAEPGATHPCTDLEMATWSFIGAGVGGGELGFDVPPGHALRVPAGARLVIQSHYVNPTSRPVRVRDAVTIETVADPSSIVAYVDPLVIDDADFAIPAGGVQTRVIACIVDQPLRIINLLGHAHEWSTRVTVELLRLGSVLPETLYDEVGGERLMFSPPIVRFPDDAPLELVPGDELLLTCQWNNTTGDILEFPAEMCVALMYYAPGNGWLTCGTVLATMGDVVPGNVDPGIGQHGCAAGPGPGEPCARPCDLGNSEGVGLYCTPGGGECTNNGAAVYCSSDFGGTADGFCTRPCGTDLVCGPEAVCIPEGGCVPVLCAS